MMPPPSPGAPPSQVSAEEEEVRPPLQSKAAGLPGPMLVGGTGRGGNSRLPAGSQSESTWAGTGAGVRTPRRGSAQPCQHWDPEAGDRVQPPCSQASSQVGAVVRYLPPPWGGGTGPRAWALPGTWKMPVPWFLLSLALGRSPVVLSLERLVGPQDVARCSPVSLGPWEGWRLLRIWFVSH